MSSIPGRIHRAEPSALKLPLLGRIKCGERATTEKGKEYPRSLDHFIAKGKYAAQFHQTYGEKPTKIEIVFFSPHVPDVCSETYVVRDKAGRLLAEGDGETWRCWSESRQDYVYGQTTLEEVEKKYESHRDPNGRLARVTLTLRFILPRIPTVFGIWSFSTQGAKSTIPAIRDTFDTVLQMTGALIVNVPFDLLVEKVKGNRPGETRVYPIVTLIPNVSQANLDLVAQLAASGQKLRGILTEAKLKQLAAAVEVDEDLPMLPAASTAEAPAPEPAKPELNDATDPIASLFPEEKP